MSVQVKRVYDAPSPDDGYRVLVDRLWPRGVKKESLDHDEWAKDAAPSNDLRAQFHGGGLAFEDFRSRYEDELAGSDAVGHLRSLASQHGTLTLLTATKDERQNHALVLADVVRSR